MARKRLYLSKDVLTAAKERIHHIADLHDSLAVCFSGGKDSLVVLHLTREVLAERGVKRVNVVFRAAVCDCKSRCARDCGSGICKDV